MEKSKSLLDFQLLLKVSALSFQPAYNLRLHGIYILLYMYTGIYALLFFSGSPDTLAASAFALTILSLIIHYAQKRLTVSVLAVKGDTTETELNIEKIIESEVSMVQLLMQDEGTNETTPAKPFPTGTTKKASPKYTPTSLETPTSSETGKALQRSHKKKASAERKAERRKKAFKLMNRRRRQRGRGGDSSSDEDDTGSDPQGSSSEDSTLPPLGGQLGEDVDLLMMESLSDSSSQSSDEGVNKPLPTATKSSVPSSGTKGRRRIVLAANFSMPTETGSDSSSLDPIPNPVPDPTRQNPRNSKELQNKDSKTRNTILPVDSTHISDPVLEVELRSLSISTAYQEKLHKACDISSKESYLCCVKVFADWLQSYPAVLAAYGKVRLIRSID